MQASDALSRLPLGDSFGGRRETTRIVAWIVVQLALNGQGQRQRHSWVLEFKPPYQFTKQTQRFC